MSSGRGSHVEESDCRSWNVLLSLPLSVSGVPATCLCCIWVFFFLIASLGIRLFLVMLFKTWVSFHQILENPFATSPFPHSLVFPSGASEHVCLLRLPASPTVFIFPSRATADSPSGPGFRSSRLPCGCPASPQPPSGLISTTAC